MFHVGGGARIYRSDGCGAIVKLDDFGRVSLITGATELGQGSETVLAMIVAETLGVPLERVDVVWGDSDRCPYSVGESGSRTTIMTGYAVVEAARDLQRQIAEREELRAERAQAREGELGVGDDGLAVALLLMVFSAWQSFVLLAGGHQRVTLAYNTAGLVANVALNVGLIAWLGYVGAALAARPAMKHVIVTGRNARDPLIEAADLRPPPRSACGPDRCVGLRVCRS